ncbi:hypothetical protein FRB94_003760 [Tulasnella sp. JGI-2019a]|nr:hypothetical protein FRB94_003760 [Tulasnella sp. JGI-2019a]
MDQSVATTGPDHQKIATLRMLLPRELNGQTYAQHWHTLLFVEEEQMLRDIEAYDMTPISPVEFIDPKLLFVFSLQVPGLAEKRPSILQDDAVHVCSQRQPDKWFEGRVLLLKQREVGLVFHGSFHCNAGDKFDARFTVNRIPMRRMHEALDVPFFPNRVLFPTLRHVIGRRTPPNDHELTQIETRNPLIATNRPQLEAVAAILEMKPAGPPFVIYGPPGTGKTVTVVEAILQLVAKRSVVRILACAPSNSAADLIAERLISLGTDKLFRLNAPFRLTGSVPAHLLPFSYTDEFGRFSVRSKEDLAKYHVVVSTCMSAGIPYGIGMATGHFTHIFIDEAGQAMEPEAMVPIKSISSNSTHFVLSGDSNQLGPIIRSGIARLMGLGLSFLERLMKREIYCDPRMHGVTIVKLTKNFRSHQTILDFSNRQFYRNELQVFGNPQSIDRFLGCPLLPNPRFPFIFHGVSGYDDREADSPSYFNIAEISIVADYIYRLVGDAARPLTPSNIGVIAPYRAQSAKLYRQFGGRYPNLKVGSVEEYQGQERDVIILTTVRTDREQVSYDLRHTLGFLVNPRRLNVAITRAKGLLIIVGDPSVLGLDPLWRKLLNYVHINGGWTGTQPDWNPRATVAGDPGTYVQQRQAQRDADMEELTDRLMNVVIAGGPAPTGGDGQQDVEDDMDASGDRPWREYD